MNITCKTEAPCSAKVRPIVGPAMAWVAQMTLRPSSGRLGFGDRTLGVVLVEMCLMGTMGSVDMQLP